MDDETQKIYGKHERNLRRSLLNDMLSEMEEEIGDSVPVSVDWSNVELRRDGYDAGYVPPTTFAAIDERGHVFFPYPPGDLSRVVSSRQSGHDWGHVTSWYQNRADMVEQVGVFMDKLNLPYFKKTRTTQHSLILQIDEYFIDTVIGTFRAYRDAMDNVNPVNFDRVREIYDFVSREMGYEKRSVFQVSSPAHAIAAWRHSGKAIDPTFSVSDFRKFFWDDAVKRPYGTDGVPVPNFAATLDNYRNMSDIAAAIASRCSINGHDNNLNRAAIPMRADALRDKTFFGDLDLLNSTLISVFVRLIGRNISVSNGAEVNFGAMEAYWMLNDECGFAVPSESGLFVSDRPVAIKRDRRGRLHATGEAAIKYSDGTGIYMLNGVFVIPALERYVLHPDSINAEVVEDTTNVELRRAFLELLGVENYLRQMNARRIDYDAKHKVGLYTVGSRFGVMNVCLSECHSTGRIYTQFVPRHIQTVDQAMRWRYGVDVYNPSQEA